MSWSALPLLLGLGGAATLAAGVEVKRQQSPLQKARAVLSARPTPPLVFNNVAEAAAALRPTFVGPNRYRPLAGSLFVDLFGVATAEEYPAPYRWQDARAIAQIVLDAASETSPKLAPYFAAMVTAIQAIDAAHLPPWRKTYAAIMVVVVPTFASNMLFHWYRPTSNTKADRFNAIISWAGIFLTLPATATAAASVDPGVEFSSLPGGIAAVAAAGGAVSPGDFAIYLDPSARVRRGNLSARDMRRCVYDLYKWMWLWPYRNQWAGGGESVMARSRHAEQRMNDLHAVYPWNNPERYLVEGNLKAVDEMTWLANAIVQASITVEFDEFDAITSLVVKVVAAVASAVAPMVGPAIGSALTTAANAISTLAALVAAGEISGPEFQALAGSGAAFMLDQAGIHLGLQDEMSKIGALVS